MKCARWMIAAALVLSPALVEAKDKITESVVKIFTTQRQPDYLRPWNKKSPQEISGTGSIIEGKRILTNAHVVLYASQIFVQADQTTDRVPAKVLAIAPGIDLAVLEVEKASFFEGRPPLTLAEEIPAIKQTVSVYGYPIGGDQMSVTQGIVSRIEYASMHYLYNGLRIQIDAALNPGNSGGPAVSDGKIVGIVFSKITEGENIGYLIAVPEVKQFLASIKDGKYAGRPELWDLLARTENEAMRAKLGLDKEAGMVVYQPANDAPDHPLKRWDVITHIGGKPLDSQGNIKIRDDLLIYFEYLVPQLAKDGKVKLTILRDRKSMEVEVPVPTDGNFVLPFMLGKYPRYFICGPMVFMPASRDLAFALGGPSVAPSMMMVRNPLLARAMDHPKFEGEEIVTLGYGLLPHRTSKGYTLSPFSVVSQINGTPVKNLLHVVELLRDAKDEYVTIDLAGSSSPIVFRRQDIMDATEDILSDEAVRKQCSDDLEKVWRKGK
jgi:S1-C subfamily serine protease